MVQNNESFLQKVTRSVSFFQVVRAFYAPQPKRSEKWIPVIAVVVGVFVLVLLAVTWRIKKKRAYKGIKRKFRMVASEIERLSSFLRICSLICATRLSLRRKARNFVVCQCSPNQQLSLFLFYAGCAEEGVENDNLFISYSSKDFSWVSENLISLLEKHSIPYIIHIRDFELGRPIVQNMADSVYNSRQVVIVLSNNYLASNFCREELHMALQRGVDTGYSALVLVSIDKLKKKQLPNTLRNKTLLDFERHKKQDWEKKLLSTVHMPGKKTANI